MTENELKKLAQLIAEYVVKEIEIKHLDELFTASLDDPYELLIAELARLMTLIVSYEDSEQYEKAAIIKNKINRLQKQIEKL
jgi:predicted RecB family endonuclease|tara:strand:+ start:447 stop:692 length:246 start_codon:yes stop_codon:yes gene_type:complete